MTRTQAGTARKCTPVAQGVGVAGTPVCIETEPDRHPGFRQAFAGMTAGKVTE